MGVSRRSLNQYLPCKTLLTVLGCGEPKGPLPATTDCPLCKSRGMRVYADYLLGGHRYDCPACTFSGDGVELASAVTGNDPYTSFRRMAISGVGGLPDDLLGRKAFDTYLRSYADPVRKIRSMFDGVCRIPCGRAFDEFEPIHTLIGFPSQPSPEFIAKWIERAGRFIRHIRFKELAEYVSIHNLNCDRNAVRIDDIPRDRWRQVLAIPFCDIPGRPIGLWCMGNDAGRPDAAFIGTVRHATRLRIEESGIGFLDAIPFRYDGPVVCMTSPEIAARIHVSHTYESSRSPAVICIASAPGRRTEHAWESLGPTRFRVVMCGEPSSALFECAKRSGGKVVLVDDAYRAKLASMSTENIAAKIAADAVPWRDALDRAVTMPSVDGNALVAGIDAPLDQIRAWRSSAPDDAKSATEGLAASLHAARCVRISGRHIAELEDSWYVDGRRISGATIALDSVDFRGSDRIYKGKVKIQGTSIPFEINQERLFNPSVFFNALIRERGFRFVGFNKRWSYRLLSIAAAFDKPVLGKGDGFIGWNQARGSFVLPGWVFEPGREPRPVRKHRVDVNTTPCVDLPPHNAFDLADIETLQVEDDPTIESAWIILLHAMETAVAPSLGTTPRRLALPIVMEDRIEAAVIAMGGISVNGSRLFDANRIAPSPWISFCKAPKHPRQFRARFYAIADSVPGSVCACRPYEMEVRRVLPGWIAPDIQPGSLDRFIDEEQTLSESCGRVLSAWLAEYCRNPIRTGPIDRAVYAHARTWWESFGANTAPIDAAYRAARFDRSIALARLIAGMYRDGLIRAPATPAAPPRVLVDDDYCGISSRALESALLRHAAHDSMPIDMVDEVVGDDLLGAYNAPFMLRGHWFNFRRSWWDSGLRPRSDADQTNEVVHGV